MSKKYSAMKKSNQEIHEENLEKDRLWSALKGHIMRERERKKQQELETAKEAVLRNEREARKKQDNIKTLGKTKEEIQQVEEQMIQLKNKKHQLFLQLKALITKEVEMEKMRKESELVSIRNDVGMNYQPYSNNEKGVKRPHSPVTQAEYYKQSGAGQPQRLYLPPKTESNITGNRLWYKPANYAQSQSPHQAWPTITNVNVQGGRYSQQNVPAHPILIPHNDLPQLVKQQQQQQQQQSSVSQQSQQPKTNSISIEKIAAPHPNSDYRRLLTAVPTQNPSQKPGQTTFFTPSGQIVYPEIHFTQNRDFSSK